MRTPSVIIVCFALLALRSVSAAPLGTAFTYQGQLTDAGRPADGTYDLTFTLHEAASGGAQVGTTLTNSAMSVSAGVFTVTLDFGPGAFTNGNRWLEIAVRTNGGTGFTILSPRQAVTAAPLALYALTPSGPAGPQGPEGPIGQTGLPGPAGASPFSLVDTNAVFTDGFVGLGKTNPATALDVNGTITATSFVGDASGLTSLPAGQLSGPIPEAGLVGTFGGAVTLNNAGNAFTGTFTGNGASLTGIGPGALADNSVNAAKIVNGSVGTAELANDAVTSATIADGTIGAADVAVNTFWGTAGNTGSTAGAHFLGTTDNQPLELKVNGLRGLRLEPASGSPNVIGGFSGNYVEANFRGATIGGGGAVSSTNYISGNFATISGGYSNTILIAESATIGGGHWNGIETGADSATIGGGVVNTIGFYAAGSTIGGGYWNSVQTSAGYATIGGGWGNTVWPDASSATIGGGMYNTIQTNAQFATIGGGDNNTIQTNATRATIGGGSGNAIQTNGRFATIAGGDHNLIEPDATRASIAGGYGNTIRNGATDSTIAGGNRNTNSGRYATVGGGVRNLASGVAAVVAGGGYDGFSTNGNTASGPGSVVGGGTQNLASGTRGTVGGGHNNSATNWYATVPGGAWNLAGGQGSLAAGRAAKALHDGAFVWSDESSDLVSTTANSVTMRAAGGYRLFSNADATAGVYLAPDGTSWASISDRNAKKDFAPVDAREVLAKLAVLPMTQWHYQWEESGETPHIGPMAQDFKAAFYPGRDDTHITTQEADGVALAAIQGLNLKLEHAVRAKDAEIQALTKRLEKLERMLTQESSGGQ